MPKDPILNAYNALCAATLCLRPNLSPTLEMKAKTERQCDDAIAGLESLIENRRKAGSVSSKDKARSSAENGKKGGRPKKVTPDSPPTSSPN